MDYDCGILPIEQFPMQIRIVGFFKSPRQFRFRCRRQPVVLGAECMKIHLTISISVAPKPGRRSRVEADLSNQLKIDTYFTAYSTPTTSVKYKVLREETAGITVGHLRQLARLGGIVPLGALAFNTMLCDICGKGENEDSIIICDKCNKGFHLYCLKPILPSVPSGEWFCDACRENQKRKYYRNLARYQENQSLIVDFFKLERPIPVPVRYNFRRSTMPSRYVATL